VSAAAKRNRDGSLNRQTAAAAERLMPGGNRRAQRPPPPVYFRFVGQRGTVHRIKRKPDDGSPTRDQAAATVVASRMPWYPGAKFAGCDHRFWLWFTPEAE
jgi:hypothetical protein